MKNDVMNDPNQLGVKVTREIKKGVLKSVLTEGPFGRRRHEIYNDKGVKVTSIEYDGKVTVTVVFDSKGRVTAIDEEE